MAFVLRDSICFGFVQLVNDNIQVVVDLNYGINCMSCEQANNNPIELEFESEFQAYSNMHLQKSNSSYNATKVIVTI